MQRYYLYILNTYNLVYITTKFGLFGCMGVNTLIPISVDLGPCDPNMSFPVGVEPPTKLGGESKGGRRVITPVTARLYWGFHSYQHNHNVDATINVEKIWTATLKVHGCPHAWFW